MKNVLYYFILMLLGCTGGVDQAKKQFFLRGTEQLNLREYKQAIYFFSEALVKDSMYAVAYNNRGIAYYELNEYRRALSDYNRALEIEPDFADALYNRSNTFFALKKYRRSLQDLERIRQTYSDSAYVYFAEGLVKSELRSPSLP